MRIGLIGTGRMGSAVASLVADAGHTIAGRFNRSFRPTPEKVADCEVLIDFSLAEAVRANVEVALAANRPLVTGTTGWHEQFAGIKELVLASNGSFLYAANFSIGVALFHRLAQRAAHLFAAFQEYDFAVHEAHHRGKIDSPSGTANLLANTLLASLPSKSHLQAGNPAGKIKPEALQISSTRVGSVPGMHRIFIDGPDETIELAHAVRNRNGFARGAIQAAEWLVGKRGFFSLEDMVEEMIGNK